MLASGALVGGLLLALQQVVPTPSVAFDLTSLSEDDYRRLDGLNLERRAVLRALEEGFAVVRPSGGPSVVVLVRVSGNRVTIEAVGPAGRQQDAVAFEPARISELHLEIIQKAAMLMRAALGTQPATVQPPVAPQAEARAGPVPDAAPDARPTLGVRAGVGLLVRSGGTDVGPWVGLEWTFAGRARAELQIGGQGSEGKGITVTEGRALAGIGYRLARARRFELGAGLLAGAVFHRYELAQPGVLPRSGTRVDGTAEVPVTAAFRILRSLAVELEVAPGMARARSHTIVGVESWQRGAYFAGMRLTLLWTPGRGYAAP